MSYKPKVYCAFQFFNEFEILKLKLEELWNVVDYFVLSESNYTHSGKPKNFNFMKNEKEFKKYRHKILWQGINDTPSDYINLKKTGDYWHDQVINKLNAQTHWDKNIESYGRDSFEKESLIRALGRFVENEDIVILGDCDEIPKASTVKLIIDNFDHNQIYHMQHDFYWYYMNILKTDEQWLGNFVCSFETFKKNSFCEIRQNKSGTFVLDAGWHFTYMGGVDRIKEKIESWGEQSLNQPHVKENLKENVKDTLRLKRDLFFRPANFVKVPIDYATHPQYLVEHMEEYSEFIMKD